MKLERSTETLKNLTEKPNRTLQNLTLTYSIGLASIAWRITQAFLLGNPNPSISCKWWH